MTTDLFEVVRAALELMGNAPASLEKSLHSVCEVRSASPVPLVLLERTLKHANENDPTRRILHIALSNWDSAQPAPWNTGTIARSKERRRAVYARIGVGQSLQVLLDDLMPVLEGSQNLAITGHGAAWKHWYTAEREADNAFYWNSYSKYLKERKNWSPKSLEELQDSTRRIISLISDPLWPTPYQAKGLVVGFVQSGKTANFTGVIARAVDAGYRLVIVLGGMLDILRNQTQRRLDKELVGKEFLEGEHQYTSSEDWNEFNSHGIKPSLRGASDWLPLTGPSDDYAELGRLNIDNLDFDPKPDPSKPLCARDNLTRVKTRLIVIKKTPAILNKLTADLKRLRIDRHEVPALIIDDESDQASVNTLKPASRREQQRTTATNDAIRVLLERLPRGQYVGYTATPFANVFINPDDQGDLFPRDFIVPLQKPQHYMGVADFYDLEAVCPEGYASNESAFVRDVRGPDSAPANLLMAIDAFVLSGAMKLYRQDKDANLKFRHHTMLVHCSQYKNVHRREANAVEDLFCAGGYTGPAGLKRLQALYDKDYSQVSNARAGGLPVASRFSDLEKYIGPCLGLIQRSKPVRVVNGDNLDDTPDFDSTKVWSIIVGGAKLSRGYTVEGLTVSYYRRKTGASDTQMQLGRWFGFRRGYQDLVRLFIGRSEDPRTKNGPRIDLYREFEGTCRDEEEFRREIQRYCSLEKGRITPLDVIPLVPQHCLPPTAKNKRQLAAAVAINLGNAWRERTVAPDDEKRVRVNMQEAERLLKAGKVQECQLSGRFGREESDFEAIVARVDHKRLLEFVRRYQWQAGKDIYQREREFLDGKLGDPEIDSWLVIAPQAKTLKEHWRVAGYDLVIRGRARIGGEAEPGRYKVYSEMAHRPILEYLAGQRDKDQAKCSPDVQALKRPKQGVLALYPVRDPNRDKKLSAKDLCTIGFALVVPPNKLRSIVKWKTQVKEG